MTHARYFDGLSARQHEVALRAAGETLHLDGDIQRGYPLADATLAEPFERAPGVLYFSDGARCEVPDPAVQAWLAEVLGYRKPRVVRWQERSSAALACLVLLVLFIGATIVWGIPAAAERIAASLPREVDQSLGRTALATLEKQRLLLPSRFSDDRLAKLEAVMRSVAPHDLKLRLLVRHAPQIGPNAMALPDGTIILTDQMVRSVIGSGELGEYQSAALAGILAHEAGHVRLRHTTRSLTSASLTAALSATLFGDFSAVAAGAPAILLNLKFSRAMETEADDHAARILRARAIPIEPLLELFEAFGEDEPPQESWMDVPAGYIATHPDGIARAERLRKAMHAK